MHCLETLKKLNAKHETARKEHQARLAQEKKFILKTIEEARDLEALKNILVYVVDHYVLKEDSTGCKF